MPDESLDSLLSATETGDDHAPPAPEAPQDDETPPPGETPAETPAEPKPQAEPTHVPLEALKDERNKRQWQEAQNQQLQAQITQLLQRLNAQPPANQPPPPKRPDLLIEPDAWEQAFREALLREVHANLFQVRRDVTDSVMEVTVPDYPAARAAFSEVAQGNEALVDTMNRAENPALFAYQQGKFILQQRELQAAGGSVAAIREKLKADLRKEWEAELVSKKQSLDSELAPTLGGSGQTPGGAPDRAATGLGASLKEILGR